jgi:hypothetical protein
MWRQNRPGLKPEKKKPSGNIKGATTFSDGPEAVLRSLYENFFRTPSTSPRRVADSRNDHLIVLLARGILARCS